jgi:hypothetical protein
VVLNTDRKDIAKAMYNRALFGYTIIQGPSSKRYRQLEDRLQALQVASAESKVGQDEFTEPDVTDQPAQAQHWLLPPRLASHVTNRTSIWLQLCCAITFCFPFRDALYPLADYAITPSTSLYSCRNWVND